MIPQSDYVTLLCQVAALTPVLVAAVVVEEAVLVAVDAAGVIFDYKDK